MTAVTNGEYISGNAIPISSARIQIGAQIFTNNPQADGKSVQFRARLEAGPTELQTWFLDAAGRSICGAYYVYVHRE
jgi:hypothetical protein